MKENRRHSMLNLLKCFACIGVVLGHVPFPGIVGKIVALSSAFAVPIFYLISGYFAFEKGKETIRRRLIKTTKIFLFAYLFSFLFDVSRAMVKHNLAEWLAANFSIFTPIKYILFCTIGFAIPLWYLIAQIETYIFWYFTVKYKKEDFVVKLIPFLFVFRSFLLVFCNTMKLEWFWRTNFVTGSLCWFVLGYYIHSLPPEKINRIGNMKLIGVACLGFLVVIAPTLFHTKINFSSVGHIPYATALFLLALKYPEKSLSKPMEYLGDKLSLWIYLFHCNVDIVIAAAVHKLFHIDTKAGLYSWIHPVLALFAVICLSYVFQTVVEKYSTSNQKVAH